MSRRTLTITGLGIFLAFILGYLSRDFLASPIAPVTLIATAVSFTAFWLLSLNAVQLVWLIKPKKDEESK